MTDELDRIVDSIVVPRPAPDRVMILICDDRGVYAQTQLHHSVAENLGLDQVIDLLRDSLRKGD